MIVLTLAFGVTACAAPEITPSRAQISVQVRVDGEEINVELPEGSSVGEVLDQAGVTLEGKDRVEPGTSTVLEADSTVQVVRVEEVFQTEEEVVPFQVIRQPSESLPEGEEQLLQSGKNGLVELTYLQVLENGQEVSYEVVDRVQLEDPQDEIILVGVQSAIAPIEIPGRLVYLADGNAWLMEGSTANRRLVLALDDLDGRIFSLSDDGQWLLFTRSSEDEEVINTLWAANLESDEDEIVNLNVQNVIHFAEWVPGSNREVAYSTVESRLSPPGWQANNDLWLMTFDSNGYTIKNMILDTNYGGVYGWWGTDYAFVPERNQIAYANPDQVGMVDLETSEKQSVLEVTPYRTDGDWAWMPGISIGPDGNAIYTVNHAPAEGVGDPERSPYFDLVVIPLTQGQPIDLVQEVGMFAYPRLSPAQALSSGETAYQVAYLQSNYPQQSERNSYRVAVMDRDGSDQEVLFPPLEKAGLEPQRAWGVWSPAPLGEDGGHRLAVLYQNNIWLIDPFTGEGQPLTGDGRVQRLDWE
jgi:hypothetical protein